MFFSLFDEDVGDGGSNVTHNLQEISSNFSVKEAMIRMRKRKEEERERERQKRVEEKERDEKVYLAYDKCFVV